MTTVARADAGATPGVARAADWTYAVATETLAGTDVVITGPAGERIAFHVPVIGDFMAENAALAAVMLVTSGVPAAALAAVLASGFASDIPGRMERVSAAEGPAVFVDYAHTPDGLERSLGSLRRVTPGQVVVVLGADGDRDTTKRADMGAAAARHTDVVVVTDFHPRDEDPAGIRAAVIAGVRAAFPERWVLEIPEPERAIRAGVALLGPQDTLVYAGPGNETYREINGVKHPYSALEETRAALRDAGWFA